MNLFKRIENGETTERDAKEVREMLGASSVYGVLIGIGIGVAITFCLVMLVLVIIF